MTKQKILEISVIALALIAIAFAVASFIYKENNQVLKVIGIICIFLAIMLNLYSNLRKKKM